MDPHTGRLAETDLIQRPTPHAGTHWPFNIIGRCGAQRPHKQSDRGSHVMLFRKPGANPALRAEAVTPTRRGLLALGCACCLGGLPISPAAAQSPDVARHLAGARAAAGDDLRPWLALAQAATPGTAPSPSVEALMAQPAPPPGRAFDNLAFVGAKWVSAWALTTSDGIILLDALNNEDEAERLIEGGLRQLGLDPARIRRIVVSHGHGDHYGGATWLQQRHGAQILMSGADWHMMETGLEFDVLQWGRPPRRDVIVEDGETIRLGDTALRVLLTPGHSPGTISLLFDVREGGRTHRALLWGGTAFNFGRRPDRMQRIASYIAGTRRAKDIATRENVTVLLSNHSGYDEADRKLQRLRDGAANPFVIGQEAVQRALTVIEECALATQAAWSV
jgi:metallo-beta-lactamase class B